MKKLIILSVFQGGGIHISNIEWPDYFPAQCPPAEARAENKKVYRFVHNNPPSRDDFKSLYGLNPDKEWGDIFCRACGVSVWDSYEVACKKKEKTKLFRNSQIAEGNILENSGLILETFKKNHFTWWITPGVIPEVLFNVSDME